MYAAPLLKSSLSIIDKPVLDQLNTSLETVDIANKHVSKKVCEWFESWQPWQQRMLLCGLTDRCSTHHLATLATTLEPVFHRDFVTNLRQRYPSAPFRLMREREQLKLRLADEKRLAERFRDDFHELYPNAIPQLSENDSALLLELLSNAVNSPSQFGSLSTFADQLSARLIVTAVNDLRDNPDLFHLSAVYNVSDDNLDDHPTVADLAPDILIIDGNSSNPSPSPDGAEPHTPPQPDDPYVSELLQSDIFVDRKLSVISEEPTNVSPVQSSESSHADDIYMDVGSPSKESRFSYSKVTEIRDPLKETKRKKSLEANVTMQNVDVPQPRAVTQHRHRSAVGTASEVATVDFFLGDRMERLGFMQREIRTGPVQKPQRVRDLYIPVQHCYKHVKWCSQIANNGKTFVRAHRNSLRRHFKQQLCQVWQWIKHWQDHERMVILSDVTKLCSTSMIDYLCQCLTLRLRDRTDIQSLQDQLLIRIFSYLHYQDIANASRVCRRWRYLCSVDELWMIKCKHIGSQEGLPNLTDILMKTKHKRRKRIDWRLAYVEIMRISEETRATLPKPDHVTYDDNTPEGMMRVDGKFYPIPSPADDSTSSGTSCPNGRMTSTTLLPVKRGTILHLRDEIAGLSLINEDEDSDSMIGVDEYSLLKDEGIKNAKDRRKSRKVTSYESSFDVSGRIRYEPVKDAATEDEYEMRSERSGSRHVARKKKRREEEVEPALDIRPELRQATDVLNKSAPRHKLVWKESSKTEARLKTAKFAGEVKSVQRVRKLQGHLDAVLCIAVSKRRLISGSMDRSIRIWDINTGRSIHKLYGHMGGVRCLSFKRDLLVSGSWDMQVMIWDLVKFERLIVLSGHRGSVSCVEFNERYIVTGSHDKTLRIWYKTGFVPHKIIHGHSKAITCLTIDGCNVLSGSSDKTIRLSSMETGECLQVFDGLQEHVLSLSVRSDLIISGNGIGQCHFINKQSGALEAAVVVHKGAVSNVAIHKNRFFTASSDSTVKEWDLMTMTCVRYLQGPRGPVRDLKVDDRHIISCGDDGNIRIWDTSVSDQNDPSAHGDVIPSTVVKKG